MWCKMLLHSLMVAMVFSIIISSSLVSGSSKSKEALSDLKLNWFFANKLIMPMPHIRMEVVECIKKQIDCSSQSQVTYGEFTYPHGMGSAVIKLFTALLGNASVTNSAAKFELVGWKYALGCDEGENVLPFECFFKPVCSDVGESKVARIEYAHKDRWRDHKIYKQLGARCDGTATYEEVVAGLSQHLKFNFGPDDFAALGSTVVEDVKKYISKPFAAIHIRLSKQEREYIDKRDHILVRQPEFWNELLVQIYKRGWTDVYIAIDQCAWLPHLQVPEGLTLTSACQYFEQLKEEKKLKGYNTKAASLNQSTAYMRSVNAASLKMDLYHLYMSDFYFADFNSNMDIVTARMRAFQNMTIVLGAIKSVFNEAYGDSKDGTPLMDIAP